MFSPRLPVYARGPQIGHWPVCGVPTAAKIHILEADRRGRSASATAAKTLEEIESLAEHPHRHLRIFHHRREELAADAALRLNPRLLPLRQVLAASGCSR